MIKVNQDKILVHEIRKQIQNNDGYCPCSIEKSEDTKCPCKAFREQEHGSCHCELYYKE